MVPWVDNQHYDSPGTSATRLCGYPMVAGRNSAAFSL